MRCIDCSFRNPPGMRFCGKCGKQLAGQAEAHSPATAERRHLSVLFCDLAELAALTQALPSGQLRDLVGRLHEVCQGAIEAFEGHVAALLDTGILAHFGYPLAHEDDAERAVLAALEIVRVLSEGCLDIGEYGDPGYSVRIGIHTGVEIVGDVESQDRWRTLAVGATHNLAARLKDAAPPGSIYLSKETHRLVEGSVDCESVGPLTLRGLDSPVPVYRVGEPVDAPTRFQRRAAGQLTPIVGRSRELQAIADGWDEARRGRARCLAVVAEAGLGKSRLVEAFRERFSSGEVRVIQMQCVPYYRNTALHPVVDMLERWFGLGRDLTPEQRSERLRQRLSDTGFDQDRTTALLATLLSLPVPKGVPPLDLPPQHLGRAFRSVLVEWLSLVAEKGPVLCVVEDLHWADPSTLSMLEHWVGKAREIPVLTLLTYRPRELDWHKPAHVREIPLGRLVREEVQAMLSHIAGAATLEPETLDQLADKSDGVPLFIEELARGVLQVGEEGDSGRRRPASSIPERLHDSLLARLDRLGTAKEVAQLGAVMGRTFDLDSLVDVSYLDQTVIGHDLTQLVEAGVLLDPGPLGREFTFRHALLQEAAYESLLQKQRRGYHRQFAQSIEARLPDVAASRPELLARHYTEAGLPHRAVPYWQRAGHASLGSHAMIEARRHLTAARETLEALEPSQERDLTELGLLSALGPAVMATEGFGAPEVALVYRRAEELTTRVEQTIEIFPALFGIHRYYTMWAHREDAKRTAQLVFRLADRHGTRAQVLAARLALAVTHFHMGAVDEAREQLELSVALAEGGFEIPRAFFYGLHPVVGSHAYLGYTLALQGRLDRAVDAVGRAREMAQELEDPLLLGFVLDASAFVHQLRKEPRQVLAYAEDALALGTERGFPTVVAWSTVLRGWALTQMGDDDGMALLEKGLVEWTASGVRATLTHILATVAEARLGQGQLDGASTLLDQADTLMDATGERFYEPGIFRIRGDISLRANEGDAQALTWYTKSLDLARDHRTPLLELQAALALVRSGLDPERGQAALLGARTATDEGFSTPDVAEARAILSG